MVGGAAEAKTVIVGLLPSVCAASKRSNGWRKNVTNAGQFTGCPTLEECVAESAWTNVRQLSGRGFASDWTASI